MRENRASLMNLDVILQMAYINANLEITSTGFDTHDQALCRMIALQGTLCDEEMEVRRNSNSEFISNVIARIFVSDRTDIRATIGYSPKWKDEASGEVFPGCLELFLPVTLSVVEFAQNSSGLYLGLDIHAKPGAFVAIGPDDIGYWQWNIDHDQAPEIRLVSIHAAPRPTSATADAKPVESVNTKECGLEFLHEAFATQSAQLDRLFASHQNAIGQLRAITVLLAVVVFIVAWGVTV